MWSASKIATGEAEALRRALPTVLATAALLPVLAACSGQKSGPESLPSQTVSQATFEETEFEEFVVTPQEEDDAVVEVEPAGSEPDETGSSNRDEVTVADEIELEDDDTVIVIEDETAAAGKQEMTLVESARAERQRRNATQKAEIVINDKNLSEYAKGQLTITESSATVPTEDEGLATDSAEEADLAQAEAYWRERGYAIRQSWKEADERVEELEGDVFNLRMRFYAEDDPFYRDSQIKPAWDHAIEELNRARDEVELRQQELADFMEEGRVAGALPGWLREGIELEPEPTSEEEVGISEPGEPDSLDGPIGDPEVAPDPGGGGE